MAGILISPTLIYADPPTHFVLKGNADTPSYVNLKTHSRIYLSDDRFVFASPDGENGEVEFLYSLYHQLAFGNAPSNVNETIGNSSIALTHDSNNTILLKGDSDSTMQIGIFSLEGQLKLKGTITTQQPLNIDDLPSGCYVAVASDSKTKLSLKFIKR